MQGGLAKMLVPPPEGATAEMLQGYLKLLAEAYRRTRALAESFQVSLLKQHVLQDDVGILTFLLVLQKTESAMLRHVPSMDASTVIIFCTATGSAQPEHYYFEQ